MTAGKETLVRVWDDTRGPGRCRSCDAKLTWFETVAGKKIPFDGDPVPRRSEHDPATRRLILYLGSDDVHWATCPDADRFRRGRS